MKTANLAIVFTDIKGFTERTSRQTLEDNQRLLEVHAQLLKPVFEAFGGRIVKSIGDAFMVTFESPTQAVLSGIAIQDRLWLHNRSAPPADHIDVRVAVNVGEVRLENKDVFGEPVNIAARVEGIAEAGEVYFTESVFLSMNKAEVPSEVVGDFELKGIPGKVKVYRVPHAPYRVEAPATPEATAGSTPPGPEASADALPPFGNLALSRVKDDAQRRRLTDPAQLQAAVTNLADKTQAAVSALAEKTSRAVTDARAGSRPAWMRPSVIGGAVAVLVVIAGAVALFSGSEVDGAIDDVASASGREREVLAQKAEALINKVPEPSERAWYRGQLLEALDRASEAPSSYRNAASKGHGKSEDRLIDLLEDEKCNVRAAAARSIGELKLKSARGALEDLAEDGGPGDDGSEGVIGAIFGCNSKDAAARALKQLE